MMKHPKRPLSPHLQIYRPQITSLLSITHRLTGVALSFGLLFLVGWLVALYLGRESFETLQSFFGFIKPFIILMTGALIYHLLNGIRHLVWDLGYGYELKSVTWSGWLIISGTVLITFLLWYI